MPSLRTPQAVFLAAQDAEPVRRGDTWHWEIVTSVANSNITADLSAVRSGQSITWEARVTMPDHGVFDLVLFAGTSEAERARGTWSIKHVQVDPAAELAAIAWEESSAGQLVNLSGVGLIPVIDSVTTQYARMDGIRRMRYRERSLRYTIEFEATWDAQRRTGALWFAGPPEEKVCWGERLEDVDCP